MAPILPPVLLLGLAAAGFWTLKLVPRSNGLDDHLNALVLPGARIPGPAYALVKQSYTGIHVLDQQLIALVGFFLTAVDGNRLDVSLSFMNLGGQVLSAWILIMVETMRVGNRKNWFVRADTALGIGVGLVGWAITAPIWFAVHLWTSPTVARPPNARLEVSSPLKHAVTPLSTIIGFGVPSVIMALPAPQILSFEAKQTCIAIQQAWAIWITISQLVLYNTVSASNDAKVAASKDEARSKYMRRAYVFALLASMGSHLTPLAAATFASVFPHKLSPSHRAQLSFSNLYVPPNPLGTVTGSVKAPTLADGALWFLQNDLYVGDAAVFLWGMTLHLAARGKERDLAAWISALVKYGAIACVVGPSGAVVLAVWSRDDRAVKNKRS